MTATELVQPRRAVQQMPEYHPPLAARDALRLDFNENTFAPSPAVLAAIHATTADSLTTYPERQAIERIVEQRFNLAPGQVLLTNGVDEAIHIICTTFLESDDEAVVWTPSFFMYDISIALMSPTGIRRVQSGPDMTFPFERLLAAITPRTKLIIIASPNNPTGAVVPRQQLLQIAAAAPHAVLLVDEAYFHFHGETTLPDIDTIPNLLVARTFSKAYGLANLRVGMVAANTRLIGFLRKATSPYNVNGMALAALPAALADTAYLDWYVSEIAQGRARLAARLAALGVPFFESHANFILMQIGPKHAALVTAMRTHGVLLRDRSSDPGCDGFVRITIGIESQVTTALEALAQSLQEIAWTPPALQP